MDILQSGIGHNQTPKSPKILIIKTGSTKLQCNMSRKKLWPSIKGHFKFKAKQIFVTFSFKHGGLSLEEFHPFILIFVFFSSGRSSFWRLQLLLELELCTEQKRPNKQMKQLIWTYSLFSLQHDKFVPQLEFPNFPVSTTFYIRMYQQHLATNFWQNLGGIGLNFNESKVAATQCSYWHCWEELHPMGPVKELIANKRKNCNSFNAIILYSRHYQGRGVLVRTRSLAFPKVHLCFYLLIFDQY